MDVTPSCDDEGNDSLKEESCEDRRNVSAMNLEDLSWDNLLALVKEKDSTIVMAGEYGKNAMEQLAEMHNQFEIERKDHDGIIETWIQENHELRVRLDSREKLVLSVQVELENTQGQLSRATSNHVQALEEQGVQSKQQLAAMKREVEQARHESEQFRTSEAVLLEERGELVERLNELKSKPIASPSPGRGDELFTLHEKLFALEERGAEHDADLRKAREATKLAEAERRRQLDVAQQLQEELEEAQKQSTNYFNHLQESREETQEVKVELDALKAEARSKGHLDQGNSLFGEVEDRRIEMQTKLKSMEVKHESLQKAYNFTQHQLKTMKLQVIHLLSMNGRGSDTDHISNLERALSQAQGEVQLMSRKLKDVQSGQQNGGQLDGANILQSGRQLPNFETNECMIEYLIVEINQLKKKLSEASADCDQAIFVRLAETDKLKTSEEQLYQSRLLADKYKNDSMRLRLSLEDTKYKLDGEIAKRQLVEKKFGYDSSNDVVSVGVLSNQPKTESKQLAFLQIAEEKRREEKERQKKETREQNARTKEELRLMFEKEAEQQTEEKSPWQPNESRDALANVVEAKSKRNSKPSIPLNESTPCVSVNSLDAGSSTTTKKSTSKKSKKEKLLASAEASPIFSSDSSLPFLLVPSSRSNADARKVSFADAIEEIAPPAEPTGDKENWEVYSDTSTDEQAIKNARGKNAQPQLIANSTPMFDGEDVECKTQ